jgi:hypothetical protein
MHPMTPQSIELLVGSVCCTGVVLVWIAAFVRIGVALWRDRRET